MIRSVCVPFPLPRERTGFGVPTLAPLSRVLQPAVNGVSVAAAGPSSASAPVQRNAPPPASAPSAGVSSSPTPTLETLSAAPGQLPAHGFTSEQLAAALQQLVQQAALSGTSRGFPFTPFQAAGGIAGIPGVQVPFPQVRLGSLPLSYPMFWAR